MLILRDLQAGYGAGRVLHGVSLAVAPGEVVALLGRNGSGRSTLFDLVSGRRRPSGGDIRLHGQRIDGLPPQRIRRLGLSRSFQVSNLFGRLSALENLRCALPVPGLQRYAFWTLVSRQSGLHRQAEALLQRLGLGARRDVPAMELAYAEQRGLELGVTVAGGAGVVLLDEPTAGMNRSETARCVGLIRELTAGCTLLMVEHDLGVVFELADRIAVLVRGELIAFDTPAAVRADPRVRQAYLGAAVEGWPE